MGESAVTKSKREDRDDCIDIIIGFIREKIRSEDIVSAEVSRSFIFFSSKER
jgi:hypothetical protein